MLSVVILDIIRRYNDVKMVCVIVLNIIILSAVMLDFIMLRVLWASKLCYYDRLMISQTR
jgi:hypothetical protein